MVMATKLKSKTMPTQYGRLVDCFDIEAENGQDERSRSEKKTAARRFLVDLQLSDHKIECFGCPSNGNCQIQQDALATGIYRTTFDVPKHSTVGAMDTSSPFIDYDPEKCILCGRCVSACHLKQNRNVLSIAGRGFNTQVAADFGNKINDSICESCGNCVFACPTGALTAKDHRKYRDWETTKMQTTCPYCGSGCQINMIVRNGEIVDAEPANGAANKNMLCVKGRFAAYRFAASKDRLTKPLIKRNGKFEKASWDEALDYVANRFSQLKADYGADSLAGFSCSRSINEDNYALQKMVRVGFGTNNVDNCARVCHAPSVHGLGTTLGSGAMTNTVKDITTDVDVILLIGSNTTEAHPVIGAQIRGAVRNGTKLIVIDPRKIDLTNIATLHLQQKGGTNVALLNGMMNVIINEGLADEKFIAERTEGYEKMKALVADYTPEKVAKICGLEPTEIIKAAEMYARADKAPIVYCLGVTEHSFGTEGVMSISNLALLVGKVGKPGCGINPLRGQNNVQGACDMGCSPFDLPGYQKLNDPKTLPKFEKAWGTKLNPDIGMTSTQVLPAAKTGKIKGLFIFGEDPLVTDPNTSAVREELASLDFLVVHELFMTETAQMADVVLPGLSYLEKEGTFTNTERRVQRVHQVMKPLSGVMDDFKVFCEIAKRMGGKMDFATTSDIMDEIAAVDPAYGGISFDRLKAHPNDGLQWPCTSPTDPGTPILHVDQFTRPGGKAVFMTLPYEAPKELPNDDYPFMLCTGRELYHYNTRAYSERTPGIRKKAGKGRDLSYIEINQINAAEMGISDGDKVRVSSRRGTIESYAAVGDVVQPDAAFMTFHFPDGNSNFLTNPATDDIAKCPDYKVCAIKIEPVKA